MSSQDPGRLKPTDSFFPTCVSTRPMPGSADGFTNQIAGGLTAREGIALEFCAALMSNPGMVGVQNGKTLIDISLRQADLFIDMVNQPTLRNTPNLEDGG